MNREDELFDTRLTRHLLRRQSLDPKALAKRLEELPDDAAHAVDTEVRFEGRRSEPR